MFSGTIDVGAEQLFFIYYGFDGETFLDNLASKPLIIAVGAPGRSSQYTNIVGIGPKILDGPSAILDNPSSVTPFANVMFLDLLGSGYSFASAPSAIPKTYNSFGTMLTSAINSFIT
jgi:carboxypeptidase C (cathepsin A)